MLSPAPGEQFTIVVSGAELDVIRLAIGRMVEPEPVKKPTTRRVTPSAAAPVYATGDARLDEFMRKHHKPGWKPPRVPAPNLRPPTLPKGSPIGSMVEVDQLGVCQVIAQGYENSEWCVTNGKGGTGVIRFDKHGAVSSVRITTGA